MSSEREQFDEFVKHNDDYLPEEIDTASHLFVWQAAIAAERKRCAERDKLFGRAMIVLKALSMVVEWELAPAIMTEIVAICQQFEADAILKGDS